MRVFGFVLVLTMAMAASVRAQVMDMQIAMKWADVEVANYRVVGEHDAEIPIGSNGHGLATVKDRVVLNFGLKLSEMTVQGTPRIENFKSEMSRLRDHERKCAPPEPQGVFELADVLALEPGLGGSLTLQVRTTYPAVQVARLCTLKETVPAKVTTVPVSLFVPGPMVLAMPASNGVRISPDKQSFITTQNGWTWTFTPSAGPVR